MFSCHLESLNHTNGILPWIVARNLGNNGFISGNPILLHDAVDVGVIKLLVLVRQRINSRIEAILRDRQLRRKKGRREDRAVILLDEWPEKLPNLSVWTGHVNMATPYPFVTSVFIPEYQRNGLGIMNHDEIFIKSHRIVVHLIVGQVGLEHLLLKRLFFALQRIVEGLCDVEEIVSPLDHLPSRLDTQFIEQRHNTVQHLSDAPPNGRGVDHLYGSMAHMRGQNIEVLDDIPAHNASVIGQTGNSHV